VGEKGAVGLKAILLCVFPTPTFPAFFFMFFNAMSAGYYWCCEVNTTLCAVRY